MYVKMNIDDWKIQKNFNLMFCIWKVKNVYKCFLKDGNSWKK